MPRVDERRDVLNEIDAGELDEPYLIKHASDYGRIAASPPLRGLKTMLTSLFDGMRRAHRPRQIREQVKTVLPSAPRQVVEQGTTRR